MCRLFGFRSVVDSQVHNSLVHADNALMAQGERHPDGWGVAYYIHSTPHIIKSTESAVNDSLFQRVSGVVSSHTVLAHIRKATQGPLSILNSHPFQFGPWVFAHNGNIKDFNQVKEKLARGINPKLKKFFLGDTDSELIFFLLLSKLMEKKSLDSSFPIEIVIECSKEVVSNIAKVIGPLCSDGSALATENYLTFILTNGETMVAFEGGQELYVSTYKNKCADRESCPSFAPQCEAPPTNGDINHLIFSSEPLQGENIWELLKTGDFIGVDNKMKISREFLNVPIK